MAQQITEQDTQHVAKLSRLKLSQEQVVHFTEQLGKVLHYVEKLEELDVEGVEPMAHPTALANRLRNDEPGEPLSVEQALSNAPGHDGTFFKVPKILGDGSGA